MKYVRRRFKKHDNRMISHMPHTIHITGNDINSFITFGRILNTDVENWCTDNIGEYLKSWAYGTGYKDKIVFFFYSKEAAVAFKLRWS